DLAGLSTIWLRTLVSARAVHSIWTSVSRRSCWTGGRVDSPVRTGATARVELDPPRPPWAGNARTAAPPARTPAAGRQSSGRRPPPTVRASRACARRAAGTHHPPGEPAGHQPPPRRLAQRRRLEDRLRRGQGEPVRNDLPAAVPRHRPHRRVGRPSRVRPGLDS